MFRRSGYRFVVQNMRHAMNPGTTMHRILLAIVLSAAVSIGAAAQEKSFKVMLVLFRGTTSAEQGFMDYLKARIPVEFIIRNVDGDRSKIQDVVKEAKQDRPDLIYAFGTTVTLE